MRAVLFVFVSNSLICFFCFEGCGRDGIDNIEATGNDDVTTKY